MKAISSVSKISKSALLASLVAAGCLVSGVANAKAQFYFNICYQLPATGVSMSGNSSGSMNTIDQNGKVFDTFSIPSKAGTKCVAYTQHMVTDGNAGDYATWTYGGATNVVLNIKSPTFSKTTAGVGSGSGDRKVSSSCQIAIPLKMVVFAPSSLNGYTQFGPAAGGTANNSGPGNLKVNVAWGITTGLTCTVDRSGL